MKNITKRSLDIEIDHDRKTIRVSSEPDFEVFGKLDDRLSIMNEGCHYLAQYVNDDVWVEAFKKGEAK